MNGITIRNTIHAALAHPDRSERRKTSLRMTIIIQIQITHEKKRIIDPRMFRNGYSAANTNFVAPHWVGQLTCASIVPA